MEIIVTNIKIKAELELTRNGPDRINHNSNKWFLEILIQHLSWHINTREPATIPWVRMVPSNSVFQTIHLFQ